MAILIDIVICFVRGSSFRGRNCLPFARNWVHPQVLKGSVLLIFLAFCVVFLCFVCLQLLSTFLIAPSCFYNVYLFRLFVFIYVYSNKTGVTSGAGTNNPSGAHHFIELSLVGFVLLGL